MSEADSVKRAVEAIGEGRPDDVILAPATHAQELAGKAPALASLLGTAKIATLARQYERRDRDAGDAQTRFKEAILWANAAVLATGVLGALIMVVGILEEAVDEELWPLLLVLGLCALVSGALASMWLFRVREGNLVEAWMSGRAHAEGARLEYFATLVRLEDGPSEPSLGLLKLEYFRRYQLDVSSPTTTGVAGSTGIRRIVRSPSAALPRRSPRSRRGRPASSRRLRRRGQRSRHSA